jgi:SPOR domain
MMLRALGLICALVMGLCAATQAMAEGNHRPAELPPQGYAGQQYVDSRGCVFLRAGTDGAPLWVPRVTAGGKPICGYPPSGKRVPVVGEAGAETTEFAPEAAEEPAEETAKAPAVVDPKPKPPAVKTPKVEAKAVEPVSQVVAIGSFGFPSNVAKATAAAEALGYPVVTGQLKGGEQGLVTVFAGPFDSMAEAQTALEKLRQSGYPDARLMAY